MFMLFCVHVHLSARVLNDQKVLHPLGVTDGYKLPDTGAGKTMQN